MSDKYEVWRSRKRGFGRGDSDGEAGSETSSMEGGMTG